MRFSVALRTLCGFLALTIATADHFTKLVASDGAVADEFGRSVAISGDIIVVGAPAGDENGIDNGSAYVFARNEDGWDQVAKLVSNDSELRFGSSVAISGDIALVGACSDNEDVFSICSVWVFIHSEDGWDQVDKLMPSERAGLYLFGWSVAISEDTALVGVPRDTFRGRQYGSARVFNRNEDGWVEVANLRAEDDTSFRFGTSVAISRDVSLIGSPEDANGTGSAYVFARNEDGWDKVAKLLADDGAQSDRFGFSVAISGDIALVGAPGDDESKGSAYVFARKEDGWDQVYKIIPNDRGEDDSDGFGWSVAINGDIAVVGACQDDSMRGSAYVFIHDEDGWGQVNKLVARDRFELSYFGCSVAISEDIALVGAYGHENGGVKSGSGYVFNLNETAAHSFQPSNSPSSSPNPTRVSMASPSLNPSNSPSQISSPTQINNVTPSKSAKAKAPKTPKAPKRHRARAGMFENVGNSTLLP